MTLKILYLLKDSTLTHGGDPLNRCRKSAVWSFVAIELAGFGATFAITQTIAAIGYVFIYQTILGTILIVVYLRFPVFILLLIPVRTFTLPKYFTAEELRILDAPTASPFTLESVGGSYGDYPESIDISPADTGVEDSGVVSDSDESVMERGDVVKLKRRRSSAVRYGNDIENKDVIEEAGPSSGPQHRRGRK